MEEFVSLVEIHIADFISTLLADPPELDLDEARTNSLAFGLR